MPQSSASPLGTLVALGGGDDDALLALLVDMLADPEASILILAMAASDATATAHNYAKALRELGATNVCHVKIDERHSADKPAYLRRLKEARLVFFTGGDQEMITEFLRDTEFLRELTHRYHTQDGFIVAGTSAGASVMPEHMLVSGYGWRALRKGGIRTDHGLGLLSNVLIDQHFVERGRFGRLAHAMLTHSMCLGLGLAEETGIIIRHGQEAEVFGDGVVMVVDGKHMHGNNLGRIGRGEPVAAQDFRVHLLVSGQRLNLKTRQVVNQE
ncbi:cyanophycinase [Hymenobacter cellulosivorans]|uniref:Cyanophycinase n=1 Tax=Hymenobacter cellulosivorans TaxID=2932249 RepID=A0ABY4FEM4_9BACT|nr:cyanophycinase [Hymenobacter cellulosivorans]UOQ54404.1 cyanophycinase [Hymenobacter cellulosivorans]